jgi:hypothetical protein
MPLKLEFQRLRIQSVLHVRHGRLFLSSFDLLLLCSLIEKSSITEDVDAVHIFTFFFVKLVPCCATTPCSVFGIIDCTYVCTYVCVRLAVTCASANDQQHRWL